MASLKYYDTGTSQWVEVSIGAPGIPAGGTDGQVLRRAGSTEYSVSWQSIGATAGNGISLTGAIEDDTAIIASKFHGVFVYRSTNQSLTNNTFTTISWNAEREDTNAFRASGSSSIVIPSGFDGYYLINANIEYAPNATGLRYIGIAITKASGVINTLNNFQNNNGSIFGGYAGGSVVEKLAAGDALSVTGYHNSGGALNVAGSSTLPGTFCNLVYLGA